jgi:hypothetical protein
MTRLAIDAAPDVAVPRRFLLTAPWWGCVAGLLLLSDGAALQSRWHPTVLAATHAFTLGVFGNLLFGSLLQFLPAAAGVRLRGGVRSAGALYLLLNAGAVLLTAGLSHGHATLLTGAAVLLSLAFALLAAITAPGLIVAAGQRLLRAGLIAALVAALMTAAAGITLALTLAGRVQIAWPLTSLTDVHAAWGLCGWVLLTLAAVARVVMPMFQGTRASSARAHAAWLAVLMLLLISASLLRLGDTVAPLRYIAAAAMLSFAGTALWLQARAPHPRNAALRAYWRAGLIASIAAALATIRPGADALLTGVLAIGIAVPLLAVGMQLEIVAFLGWIDLHRRCGRGTRLPGIQRLLPELDKWCVLYLFLGTAFVLLAAATWPSATLTRSAGVALIVCHAGLAFALHRVGHRKHLFLAHGGE